MLGAEGWDDVPISSAVRASTALPMVYEPHRIKDRELVDGGIVSTTNLDIAVEAGAKFIVVVNPLVPYVNDFTKEIPTLFGTRKRHVSDMGFPKIGYQTFKLLAYQRLHEMAERWQERYPGVDIVLIEPEPDDELMFETNILNYTRGSRSPATASTRSPPSWPSATTSSATSPPATASRSPPRACARSSSTTRPSGRRPAPGGASSSRPPARCCASAPASRDASHNAAAARM